MTYLLDVMCIVKIQSVTTGTRSTTGCLQTTRRMTAVINESCPPPFFNTPDEPLSSPLDKQQSKERSALSNVGWHVDPPAIVKLSTGLTEVQLYNEIGHIGSSRSTR